MSSLYRNMEGLGKLREESQMQEKAQSYELPCSRALECVRGTKPRVSGWHCLMKVTERMSSFGACLGNTTVCIFNLLPVPQVTVMCG